MLRELRDEFVDAARAAEIPLHRFRLRDFCLDCEQNGISEANELASKLILEFCIEDGTFNREKVPVFAVLGFLKMLRGPRVIQAAGEALNRLFGDPPVSSDSIEEWAREYFPGGN